MTARSCAIFPLLAIMMALPAGGVCKAADKPDEKPAEKPLFLVARPSILDPVFAKSVVLMLPLQGEPIVVGLIVNKPTKLQLVKIFPDTPTLKDSTEPAYLGGPVDPDTGALAFHAAKAPKQAMLLFGDVYLTFDLKLITKLLRDPKQTGDMRLFLGRAQWDPRQLQGEALEGSWYSLRAEGNIIFEHDSENLWKRMHTRAEPPSEAQTRLPRPLNVKVRGSTHLSPAYQPCSLSLGDKKARVPPGRQN